MQRLRLTLIFCGLLLSMGWATEPKSLIELDFSQNAKDKKQIVIKREGIVVARSDDPIQILFNKDSLKTYYGTYFQ